MVFKRADNAFQKKYQKKIAHSYQKLTDVNVSYSLFDYFQKTRNNHTRNMLKLSHSDGNRGEGGYL